LEYFCKMKKKAKLLFYNTLNFIFIPAQTHLCNERQLLYNGSKQFVNRYYPNFMELQFFYKLKFVNCINKLSLYTGGYAHYWVLITINYIMLFIETSYNT